MKLTRTLSVLTAAVVMLSQASAVGAYAYGYKPTVTSQEDSAQFAVLMWTENEDGTLTINGCVPFTSLFVGDYPTTNVLSVFVYKGVLPIPSEINGKAVTAVKGVNITKGLDIRYVKVYEELEDISDKAFADDVYIVTTDKEYKAVTHR